MKKTGKQERRGPRSPKMNHKDKTNEANITLKRKNRKVHLTPTKGWTTEIESIMFMFCSCSACILVYSYFFN